MTPKRIIRRESRASIGAIPAWLQRAIDTSEIAPLPAPAAARMRRIGARLKANLIAYKREARSLTPDRMLCRQMAVASLSAPQIRTVQRIESTMSPRVTLVAYAWPWRRRPGLGDAS